MDAKSWTVEGLKTFLKKHDLPISGTKQELLVRVSDFLETKELEEEFGVPFTDLKVPVAPRLEDLPENGWQSDFFPDISEDDVMLYLRNFGSYTKNYRTYDYDNPRHNTVAATYFLFRKNRN